jgi:hypothetical protein
MRRNYRTHPLTGREWVIVLLTPFIVLGILVLFGLKAQADSPGSEQCKVAYSNRAEKSVGLPEVPYVARCEDGLQNPP